MRFYTTVFLILLIDLYVFFSLRGLVSQWPLWLKVGLSVLYWLMPVLVILWFATDWFGALLGESVKIYLRSFLMMVYLSKIAALLPLLADDIRRGLGWLWSLIRQDPAYDPSRSDFLRKGALILGSLPIATLTYGMVRNPYRYKLHEVEVPIRDLPTGLDGFRIAQISDIHAGSFVFTEPVKNAVEMINGLEPDLAVFTGDLVNVMAGEMDPLTGIFDKIRARHGVYSILGNHDYGDYHHWESPQAKEDNFHRVCDLHGQMGWRLLRNESALLEHDGHKVGLIGVENFSTHRYFPRYGDLAVASEGMEGADVRLLLSHDPTHWDHEVLARYPEIALTMSGHTHGFQFGIEIPGVVRWSPSQYMYPRWAGLYREGKQYLYVNRGLGFLGYPGRVGILPEITLLKLTRHET